MTNRPKAIGTAAETLVTRWLRGHGYPDAERTALAGAHDQGDVRASRTLVVEVKAGQQTRKPGDALLDTWLRETEQEAAHATTARVTTTGQRAPVHGLLVLQRHGTRDVARWWVVTRGTWAGYVWRELADALHDPAVTPWQCQPLNGPWDDDPQDDQDDPAA